MSSFNLEKKTNNVVPEIDLVGSVKTQFSASLDKVLQNKESGNTIKDILAYLKYKKQHPDPMGSLFTIDDIKQIGFFKEKLKHQALSLTEELIQHQIDNDLSRIEGIIPLLHDQRYHFSLQEFNKIVENTLTNVVDMIDKGLVTLSRNTIAREIEHKKKIPEIIIDIQTVLSSEQYAMFHNVLTNAIKYGGNNISVKSQLHKTQQGVVVIEIQDNGEGIELNKAKNILQGENVESSDHEHGHGIGLATTARLLKNKFKIEKGINGKYNTFVLEFTLPVGGKL